ncbi:MAG: hypothetical protein WCT24_03675 [Patescibacteria group bacterium]
MQSSRGMYGQRASRRWPWIVLVLVLLAAIGSTISFFVFRGEKEEPELPVVEEITSEETSDVIVTQLEDADPQETLFQEADFSTANASGTAKRGITGDLFTHVIVAGLPAIDTATTYYEGWLVKPTTLEFFSTGEFFAREDGKWGLVWERKTIDAPYDILDYRQVVITKEMRDGNIAPSPEHLVEATFDAVVDN